MKHIATLCGFLLLSTICIQAQKKTNPLFSLLSPSQTGVDFENTLVDQQSANILIYSNFYGGAGVGVGDFDKDGLPDLYFAGNQVPDRLYRNLGEMKFEDLSEKVGLRQDGGWSTSVVVADVNNDGWQDIYVTRELYDDAPELRRNLLYINKGKSAAEGGPAFMEMANEYGLGDTHRTRHATFLDYDRDGDLDLFVLNQPPNPGNYSPLLGSNLFDSTFTPRLYQNNGPDGPFVDVTGPAGLVRPGFANSVVAVDLNRDGWTDLYVANDFDAADRLWLNNQDGTFTNVIDSAMRHISFYSMGVDAADLNHDGWQDLMVLDMVAEDNYRLKANMSGMNPQSFWKLVDKGEHYQYMFNALHLNQGINENGTPQFSEISQLSGMPSTDWSWSNLLVDLDNDGWQDAYVTNGLLRDIRNTDAAKTFPKYIHKTITEYVEAHPNAGDVSIWDILDLDEALALIPSVPLPNYAFRNKNGLQFEKIGKEWGLDDKGFSNGSAYADLDLDGDLDLIVNNINAPAFIYQNHAAERLDNNWLRVKLESPKAVLGTKLKVKYGDQVQYHELTNVRGMYSTSEAVFHIGLGNVSKVDIALTWPDGRQQEMSQIAVNQLLTLNWESSLPSAAPILPTRFDGTFSNKKNAINFTHLENAFDDYEKQVLLPHKQSQFGPALATADVNGDGLEDVFVGGAIGQIGQLFLQTTEGTFEPAKTAPWAKDKYCDDVAAAFFDLEGDGDLDLYVVSGGYEFEPGYKYYQDRMYLNLGGGNFFKSDFVLPDIKSSGGCVVPCDYDGDGDMDVFVGGRLKPWAYPEPVSSYLLENEEGKFVDVTAEKAAFLHEIGMVTSAVWTDVDGDKKPDLALTGEWMDVKIFLNNGQSLEPMTTEGLDDHTGWWYSLHAVDIDGDGDQDLVAGNLGLNYKYKASSKEPFSVHYDDFDDNGSRDIVLSYYNFGEQYPLRGRSCSSQQVPDLKEKFPTYDGFASANLADVYGIKSLKQALHYEATTFASAWFENLGEGRFARHDLPLEAQLSSINGIVSTDVDQDGHLDLILAGNLFPAEVETPRNDAGMGCWLKGDGKGHFEAISPMESGLRLPYDVKALRLIQMPTGALLVAACNDGPLQVVEVKLK